jgi:hypothetical protein
VSGKVGLFVALSKASSALSAGAVLKPFAYALLS